VPPHEPTVAPSGPVPDGAGEARPAADAPRPLVDFRRTARRLAIAVAAIGVLVLATWFVLVLTTGAPPRLLAELAGLGLLGAFAVEVVVVGGSAVRGMLTAGERGERLASSDVALVPPQLLRRRGR
jgi:hypothetical protein